MHKRLPATLAALLSIGFANAQPNDTLRAAAGFYQKISPLAVLETDGGIGFSGEFIFPKSSMGVQLEVQPIFFSLWSDDSKNGLEPPLYTDHSGGPHGIKLRPEIRWYLSGVNRTAENLHNGKRSRSTNRWYLATDFLFKKTWRERTGKLQIGNGISTPYSTQTATYTDIKTVTGFDLKTGVVFPASKSGNRWIEVFGGLGIRFKQFSYDNLPPGAIDPLRRSLIQFRWLTNGKEIGAGLKETSISIPFGLKYVSRL